MLDAIKKKTALITLGTILTIYGGFSWLTKWTSGVPHDELRIFLTLMIIGIVLLIIPRFIKKR